MTLAASAHAKVNLGLGVIALRGDGFHELDTIFARLDLHDDLTFEPAGSDFRLEAGVAEDLSRPLPGATLLQESDNLVLRAARLYQQETGCGGGTFTLVKRIPLAAGLGGGSADAAAALLLLQRAYPAAADLAAMGRQLGSDVGFFLTGWQAARGRGRGERLSHLELPRRALVLANPGVSVSSGDAYRELQNFSRRLDPDTIRAGLEDFTEPRYVNALQSGVTRERPQIREVLMALRSAGLPGVLMSGSGATCFGLARDAEHAAETAELLRGEHPHWWVRDDAVGGSG
jgi:4-diphosphocytidyl-2-C-methyl-D-erythritol kinase